jgi:hypothetical protein
MVSGEVALRTGNTLVATAKTSRDFTAAGAPLSPLRRDRVSNPKDSLAVELNF